MVYEGRTSSSPPTDSEYLGELNTSVARRPIERRWLYVTSGASLRSRLGAWLLGGDGHQLSDRAMKVLSTVVLMVIYTVVVLVMASIAGVL